MGSEQIAAQLEIQDENTKAHRSTNMPEDLYVILEWVHDEPPFPRYCLATPKHAEELGTNVRPLQTCASLEVAALVVGQLNTQSGG